MSDDSFRAGASILGALALADLEKFPEVVTQLTGMIDRLTLVLDGVDIGFLPGPPSSPSTAPEDHPLLDVSLRVRGAQPGSGREPGAAPTQALAL